MEVEKCGHNGVLKVCTADVSMEVSEGCKWRRDLQLCTSGKRGIMLRNRPGSASVRYALKVPSTPIRRNVA